MPTTISNTIAIDSHTKDWIQGTTAAGKQVLSAKLTDVMQDSIIEVRASGSANGSFYYRIVETTNSAEALSDADRILQADSGWFAMETSTLFRVTKTQTLNFAVEINKYDTTGKHTIYHLTLIAKVL